METEKRPSRSSMPKLGLERIYIIDAEIASGKYPNTKDLVKALYEDWREIEVSIPTVSRDIEHMRDRLNAPIEYSALKRGYYYTEKTYRLPAVFTSAENLLALGMAKSILSLYRETPLYEASVNLLESITAPLASDGNRDWLENRIMVPKIATAKVAPNIWDTIVAGLKENRIVTFEYLGKSDDDYHNRRVRPYQLLFDSGAWYLYGYAEERKALRVFSLSRMKNAQLSKDHFTLPTNYSYTGLTGGSFFGVFIGMEKHHFSIDCFGDAEFYATERQWAEDQKIKKLDTGVSDTGVSDTGVSLEFTSTQYDKVLQWVLSYGCNAIPRKPQILVDDWKWHIKEMAKQAKSINSRT